MNFTFSKRAEAIEEGIFAALAHKKNELVEKGMEVYNFSIGTPDFQPPKHVMDAMVEACKDPENYKYAISDRPELIRAMQDFYQKRFGVRLETDEIMTLYGSQEGMAHVAVALCDPGDIMLAPNPGYPVFSLGPQLAGAKIETYPLYAENNFLPKFEDIPEETARAAKFMIVSYPSNPVCSVADDAFYEELSKAMQEGQTLMVSVGTSRVAGSQAFRVKKGQRFITNPNTASMGFCLPAATGICVAQPGKPVVCVTGEGSLQMNLQELQTIWQNRLPVKLFVINNQGYHSIRQTQQSYFEPPLVGVGAESGDLSFPDLSKIIPAYGFSYRAVHAAEELPETLHQVLEETGASVCEVFVTKYQKTEPKTSAKKLPDGSMVSAPLEDMYPFLSKEELEENMFTETNGEMQ